MKDVMSDGLLVAGLVLVASGAWVVSAALGLVVAGAGCMFVAYLIRGGN